MQPFLILVSVFTLAAATWLTVMETLLGNPGYAGHIAVAALIAAQSMATLMALTLRAGKRLRVALLLGAAAVIVIGLLAVVGILSRSHFEGYVLVIGGALIVQGVVTFLALGSRRRGQTAVPREQDPVRPPRSMVVAEVLMVMPAAAFLAGGLLRGLNPTATMNPAHPLRIAATALVVFRAFTFLSPPVNAMLLVGLPSMVLAAGVATLLRTWQRDQMMGADLRMLIHLVWRHLGTCVIAATMVGAAGMLAAIFWHGVVG